MWSIAVCLGAGLLTGVILWVLVVVVGRVHVRKLNKLAIRNGNGYRKLHTLVQNGPRDTGVHPAVDGDG